MSKSLQTGLVVDDHPDALNWVADALAVAFPQLAITTAHDLSSARALVAKTVPDIALIDLDLPDGTGIDLIRELHQRDVEAVKIVSSVFGDDQHLFDALRAGAQGYILKEESQGNLATMLQGIIEGQPPLSPSIARRLLTHFHLPTDVAPGRLTARERDVLTLLAKGYTVKRVASLLDLTVNTTASYVKNVYRKLDVNNRAEATLEASRRGLVNPDAN